MSHFPSSPRCTVLSVVAAFAVGIVSVVGLESGRDDTFRGTLHVVTHAIRCDRAARIGAVTVSLGDRLQPDHPVAVLVDESLPLRIATVRSELSECNAELDAATARAELELKWRLRELDQEMHEVRLQSAAELHRQFTLEFRETMWNDFIDELDQDGNGSVSDGVRFTPISFDNRVPGVPRMRAMVAAEAARHTAEVHEARAAMCDVRIAELEELKTEITGPILSASGVDELRQRRNRIATRLSELEGRSAETTLVAATYGRVSRILCRTGTAVVASQTILETADYHQVHVDAYVPSQRIEDFPVDREVTLQFTEDRTRRGRVKSVALAAIEGSAETSAMIVVRIEPAGKLWPELPVGSTVLVRRAD